ncbi:hypothetical protein DdX_19328 [Ditylenchus destructor]|uniref:Uncharacterized protein n=1 Tax=Ditylenchus destructor TaxID=166010 RepID=A0AAD4MI58_9BILA|nr:hypothetical protein DdX_19328 [Ditylenchus destructor]
MWSDFIFHRIRRFICFALLATFVFAGRALAVEPASIVVENAASNEPAQAHYPTPIVSSFSGSYLREMRNWVRSAPSHKSTVEIFSPQFISTSTWENGKTFEAPRSSAVDESAGVPVSSSLENGRSNHLSSFYDVKAIDKSTNSVEPIEDSGALKERSMDTKSDWQGSGRLSRFRRKHDTSASSREIHVLQGRANRRQRRRKTEPLSNGSMTSMDELEVKSDAELQKTMHRTTMRTPTYGNSSEVDLVTPASSLITHHSMMHFPQHPVAPIAQNLPPAPGSGIYTGVDPSQSSATSSTSSGQANRNITTEQFEQLGCGFDLLTQSCKDVFQIGWCQQCADFGNIFLHDCKCTSVTALYSNAMAAFASAAAAAGASAAINANIANQTLYAAAHQAQQGPQPQQPGVGFAAQQPYGTQQAPPPPSTVYQPAAGYSQLQQPHVVQPVQHQGQILTLQTPATFSSLPAPQPTLPTLPNYQPAEVISQQSQQSPTYFGVAAQPSQVG